jgi:hypothetical protein
MNFEDAGKVLDREISKLAKYLDGKVKPSARDDMARALRRASRELQKLAENLDKSAH